MKTIAIANQKGGTGKTTTAYNLGIALTQQGYRVLMVDFDPQGNLSCYCGIPPEQDLEQTITELLMKVAYEKPLSHRECVYQSKRTDDSAPQVDFIPSNLRLASFELAMGTMMCREVLLKTCLEQYSSQYDYCIIDCSPSVGLLLTNALSAANEVIIPMQAQPFSVVGMSQLTNSISSVQRKINPGLHIRGVLLTMTQHTKVSEHYAHDVRAKYGRTLRVFTTEIPYNVKVQESQAFAAPTILYEPKSSSARAYVDFTQEVLGHGREEQVYERDAGKALLGLVGAAVRATKPVPVGHYAGFEITVEYKPLEKVFHAHLVGEATHTTKLGNDAAGNMIRFQNVVSALPQDLNRLHGSLEQLTKQLTNAEEELKQPFFQEQELSDKSARLAELDALLNVGNDAPIIEGEAEELEEEPEDALIQSDDELER